MRDTLSVQLTLFRRQKAEIARALSGLSPAFKAYERAYKQNTSRWEALISVEDVADQVRNADIVFVGDYHTLPAAQETYLALVRAAQDAERPVVLAMEFAQGRHQQRVEAFLRGALDEEAFRSSMALGDLWTGFRPIFLHAKKHRLRIVGIDRPAHGKDALHRRDAYAARRIVSAASSSECPRVLVLMGQFHIAPGHLPAEVRLRAPAAKQLIVYQNCEDLHWSLARQKLLHSAEAVRLREGEVCLLHTSPVLCQQSFLDYLEGETVDHRSATERFRDMARAIARVVCVDDVEEALSAVEVATPADPQLFERLAERGAYSAAELDRLRRHLLSRESCYLPQARMAYLASASLSHAAEEAAHWVRHVSVGKAMERPRRGAQAFYARTLEEALGYFGSKLINPARRCTSVAGWAKAFRSRRGENRDIAAYVLAHEAAERDSVATAAKLVPFHRESVFLALSHAVGYLLGEDLFRAFERSELSREALSSLFRNPFNDAQAVYTDLRARFRRVVLAEDQ